MNHSPIPRVAAIHDLSCFGRAALTVVIPILSTMGIQVCPLPTAVLSTHGRFPGYHFVDLTRELERIVTHWRSLGLHFDAIYSGFLGSPQQVDIMSAFIRKFSHDKQLVVIDPVLGDHGKLYGVTDAKMLHAMRQYIKLAHVITPNLTEAALLLDEPYHKNLDERTAKNWMLRLAQKGPESVILTSVSDSRHPTQLATLVYHRGEDRFQKIATPMIPAHFPGTGDAFTSVVTGSLLRGERVFAAAERAVQFLAKAMAVSVEHNTDEQEGIALEAALHHLVWSSPPQVSKREAVAPPPNQND